MKRGPKSSLSSALKKRICESLEKCNTIKTAMHNSGMSERVFYDWVKKKPNICCSGLSRAISGEGKTCPRDYRCQRRTTGERQHGCLKEGRPNRRLTVRKPTEDGVRKLMEHDCAQKEKPV